MFPSKRNNILSFKKYRAHLHKMPFKSDQTTHKMVYLMRIWVLLQY